MYRAVHESHDYQLNWNNGLSEKCSNLVMFHLIGQCADWQLVLWVCFLQILPQPKAMHVRCVCVWVDGWWLLGQVPVRSIWTKEQSISLFRLSPLLNYPWLITSVSPEQMDRWLPAVHGSPHHASLALRSEQNPEMTAHHCSSSGEGGWFQPEKAHLSVLRGQLLVIRSLHNESWTAT